MVYKVVYSRDFVYPPIGACLKIKERKGNKFNMLSDFHKTVDHSAKCKEKCGGKQSGIYQWYIDSNQRTSAGCGGGI